MTDVHYWQFSQNTPSTFSLGHWKCMWLGLSSHRGPLKLHPGDQLAILWEPGRQFLKGKRLPSEAPSASGIGYMCSLCLTLQVHALLPAEPNFCLTGKWKLRKSLHHQENALPHPPGTPEPQQVTPRLTLAGTPVSWAGGGFGHQLLVPLPSEGPGHCWHFQLLQVSALVTLWCLHISTTRLVYRPWSCKNL